MNISPISAGRREAPLSIPNPSGPPVAQVNARPVEGSPDIGTGNATVNVTYPIHGHEVTASAGGKNVSIPTNVHGLGVIVDAQT